MKQFLLAGRMVFIKIVEPRRDPKTVIAEGMQKFEK